MYNQRARKSSDACLPRQIQDSPRVRDPSYEDYIPPALSYGTLVNPYSPPVNFTSSPVLHEVESSTLPTLTVTYATPQLHPSPALCNAPELLSPPPQASSARTVSSSSIESHSFGRWRRSSFATESKRASRYGRSSRFGAGNAVSSLSSISEQQTDDLRDDGATKKKGNLRNRWSKLLSGAIHRNGGSSESDKHHRIPSTPIDQDSVVIDIAAEEPGIGKAKTKRRSVVGKMWKRVSSSSVSGA